jgi:hypothetical protein
LTIIFGDSRNTDFVQATLPRAPYTMFFDPPFQVDYLQWTVPSGCRNVVLLGRGKKSIEWEFTRMKFWNFYEIMFHGLVRGTWSEHLPCCNHYWARFYRSKAKQAKWWDAKVLKAEGVRITKDDRPFSVQDDKANRNKHPHAKSTLLYALIVSVTPRGKLIYDPCCGSSELQDMAEKHGREYIGIENDPEVIAGIPGALYPREESPIRAEVRRTA